MIDIEYSIYCISLHKNIELDWTRLVFIRTLGGVGRIYGL